MPLTSSSLNATTLTVTPRLAARRTFFRDSWGRLVHQSSKEVTAIAAKLSHSQWYRYFGTVSGSFCANEKMSARRELFLSCSTNLLGSRTASPSTSASSFSAATRSHFPVTTTGRPHTSADG